MSELAITRTPNLIAAEINSIKEQTRKMLLFNSIEIGNRLIEAKAMLDHGQWGKWLEESVDYSQSTANNLMRIAEEYGSKQIVLFGSNANSQALGNLSYTQAVALLGVPQDEREEFVKEHDIDGMSTRELQQAIKERDQALQEKQQLETKLASANLAVEQVAAEGEKYREEAANLKSKIQTADSTVQSLRDQLQKQRQESNAEVEKLYDMLQQAKNNGSSDEEVQQLKAALQEAQGRVEQLTQELNKPVEPVVVTQVPEEIERELEELRAKTKELEGKANQPVKPVQASEALLKFKVRFDTLVKGFGDLLSVLTEIEDPETREKYKGAVTQLIGKMSERL